MATTVIKTLGNGGSSNGYDCADFNAFAALVPTDLVAADQQWILEVDSTHGEISLSSAQAITGKTVDATRNIIIRAKTGKSFNDHAGKTTNALRYNAANGAAITNSSNAGWYVVHDFGSVATMEGIQLRGTSTSPHTLIYIGGDIDKCIIECGTSAYENACVRPVRIINSVVYTVATAGYTESLVKLPWDGGANSRITSSTLYSMVSSFTAIVQPGGGATLKSSAVFGFGTLYSNDGSGGSLAIDHSSTNLGTMAGTANLTSQTTAGQFESVGTLSTLDLRVKTGSGLIGAGLRDQTYTNDLDALKQTRSTTTPTIGAFEYGVSAGGTPSLVVSDGVHAHAADNIALTIIGTLSITDAAHAHAADSITLTATSNGTITIPAIRDWGTKALKTGQAGVQVDIRNISTGSLVVRKTGQTTHATTGVCVVTDAAIVAGTTYEVVTRFADGSRGMWDYTAS